MAGHGARVFILLSERDNSASETHSLTYILTARNQCMRAVSCDVSKQEQVADTIQQASSDWAVKGVVHAALSLPDLSFDKLAIHGWRDGIAVKTQGTINLHEAMASPLPGFFTTATSTESI